MSWPKVALLEAVIDKSSGHRKLKTDEYQKSGFLPIIDQGASDVAGFFDDTTAAASVELPVVIFGDHTKHIKYASDPFVVGADGVKILSPKDGVDARYLYHFLSTVNLPDVGYSRHFKYLKEVKIPLPPLEEQKRIAAILDKADELRRLRRRAIDRLDTLAQSIFYDMFGNSFQDTEITKFIRKIETGKNLVGNDDEDVSAYRVLKISAVNRNGFRPVETKALPSGYEPPAAHFVRNGDLLFSRANTSELVGLACIVDQAPERTALPDKLWRLVPESDARTEFLEQAILSPSSRRQIEQLCSGTSGSMKNISKAKFETLRVPAATPELQKSFANRCKSVREQKRVGSLALEETESLFASLQQRAFRGEL